jgi:microcystin degradation protein MlrC
VVTEADQALADFAALELAELFWQTRYRFGFYNETHYPEEALRVCLDAVRTTFPAVISDSGDNPTAGSSGDVTGFLHMILSNPEATALNPPLIYQYFYDPQFVSLVIRVGLGGSFEANLGATFDTAKSSPLHAVFLVKSIVLDWEGSPGTDIALVQVRGIDVVVASRHIGAYDPEMMRALGIVPEKRKIIVVKLGYLEPEIRAIARFSVMALTSGSTNEVLNALPYKFIDRPVFPLDTEFEPAFTMIRGK